MGFVTTLVMAVLNAAIVGVILLLVGALILWGLGYIHVTVPDMVQKLYIALVVLICLAYIVAALLGVPMSGPISKPFWH